MRRLPRRRPRTVPNQGKTRLAVQIAIVCMADARRPGAIFAGDPIAMGRPAEEGRDLADAGGDRLVSRRCRLGASPTRHLSTRPRPIAKLNRLLRHAACRRSRVSVASPRLTQGATYALPSDPCPGSAAPASAPRASSGCHRGTRHAQLHRCSMRVRPIMRQTSFDPTAASPIEPGGRRQDGKPCGDVVVGRSPAAMPPDIDIP